MTTKEQSYNTYRTDVYFPKPKLGIGVDENGEKDKIEDKEMTRNEKELNCKFIRINLDEENYDQGIHLSKTLSK